MVLVDALTVEAGRIIEPIIYFISPVGSAGPESAEPTGERF
ncbi:hypothetical protein ACT3UD_02230 [Glutamicibacter sp. 287]|nr:hypothetical protein [Glutamicibacter sp. BW80]